MIDAPVELQQLLAGAKEVLMADLYEFVLKSGETLRYTSAGLPLTVEGVEYSNELAIRRGTIVIKAGIEVDELSLTVYPAAGNLVKGRPFLHAIRAGLIDGAEFTLRRAFFFKDWSYCYGTIIRFYGRVADISDYSRSEVPITVKSYLELLNIKMPRNVYQPGCRRAVFDAGCALVKNAWGKSGTVLTGSTAAQILCGLTDAAGYYDLGVVTFTSGGNSGISRTVKSSGVGTLALVAPLPFPPAIGDAFTAYPGCDHTMSTCESKFNNLKYFAGEPFVPVPETAY